MYQNLINSLKKILDSKATQAEKLLKISTLVDFADGLDKPNRYTPEQKPNTINYNVPNQLPEQNPNKMVDAKKPIGAGPLLGVEDVK